MKPDVPEIPASAAVPTAAPRPRKRLGQHFLVDGRVIRRIFSRAALDPSSPVLEVGPGRGALTRHLGSHWHRVAAVEKDPLLVAFLQEKLQRAGLGHVVLVCEDILKWDFSAAAARWKERFQVVGNLPYNISGPFLQKLLCNRQYVTRAVLMFQSEVGRRLAAQPGVKAYGALTLLVQYHARVVPLLEVPREAFRPRPKVSSMVVSLDFQYPHPIRARSEDALRRLVKGAFAHRRKTLRNALRDAFPAGDAEAVARALTACGIGPGARAESLSLDDFLRLSDQLELT